jgi:hypothetical protein
MKVPNKSNHIRKEADNPDDQSQQKNLKLTP